jgi:SNF2 family DNA or RNA helicase
MRTIKFEDGFAAIRFPYNADLVELTRGLPGRKWDADNKRWLVPITLGSAPALLNFASNNKFTMHPGVHAVIDQLTMGAEKRVELLAEKAESVTHLLPFQRVGVEYILMKRRVLLADQMGLGKTLQSIAVTQVTEALPALVVCPAFLKNTWRREILLWWPDATVELVSGREPHELVDATFYVLNYDILDGRVKQDGRLVGSFSKDTWAGVLSARTNTLICDESHFLTNPKSKRTRAVLTMTKRGFEYVMLLTGTPITSRPIEFLPQLKIIDALDELGGWYHFVHRYCDAYEGSFGMVLDGASNLEELNARMRATCYIRRTKPEVLPELPEKRRVPVVTELSKGDMTTYRDTEQAVAQFFAEKATADPAFLKKLEELPLAERLTAQMEAFDEVWERTGKIEQLTRIEALKQTVAQLKLSFIFNWIHTFLESDQKLVVFAEHVMIVDAIATEFEVPPLHGGTKANIDEEVERFQSDRPPDGFHGRLLVMNMKVGGLGLTLTAASDVAFAEQGWTPAVHDQAEDRCHRIGTTQSVTAWYLLAKDTIDTEIYELIEQKRNIVDAATDGTPFEADTLIVSELVRRMLGRVEGQEYLF